MAHDVRLHYSAASGKVPHTHPRAVGRGASGHRGHEFGAGGYGKGLKSKMVAQQVLLTEAVPGPHSDAGYHGPLRAICANEGANERPVLRVKGNEGG